MSAKYQNDLILMRLRGVPAQSGGEIPAELRAQPPAHEDAATNAVRVMREATGDGEMSKQVESRIEALEALLKKSNEALYSVLCESNGISDNEWKAKDGTIMVPEWPMSSFWHALEEAEAAMSEVSAFLDPAEAERQSKWRDACAAGAWIVDRFKADLASGKAHPNRAYGSLQRNIADAIYGTLKYTAADRKAGVEPTAMADHLDKLVASGDLVEVKPSESS